jgi:hypothetical protein
MELVQPTPQAPPYWSEELLEGAVNVFMLLDIGLQFALTNCSNRAGHGANLLIRRADKFCEIPVKRGKIPWMKI